MYNMKIYSVMHKGKIEKRYQFLTNLPNYWSCYDVQFNGLLSILTALVRPTGTVHPNDQEIHA